MHQHTSVSDVLRGSRFRALRPLGSGGSGLVLEADDDELGRVAVKVLRVDAVPTARDERRLLGEAERIRRVCHPGLVRLLDAGLLPTGRPYLAMPVMRGETLARRLVEGPIPAGDAVRIFGQLARAVHVVHEAGMVHRDIKPENVMLTEHGPVLLDFGIAKDLEGETGATTVEGTIRGTPAYMAPERFFGARADVRSDVYELGVVLYVMLVGKLPWGPSENVGARLAPLDPRGAGIDVSRSLAGAVLRALSTRPEVRQSSALAFAEEIDQCLLGGDAETQPAATSTITVETPELPGGTGASIGSAPRRRRVAGWLSSSLRRPLSPPSSDLFRRRSMCREVAHHRALASLTTGPSL